MFFSSSEISDGAQILIAVRDADVGVLSLQVSTCPKCGGEGQVISEYCRKCGGDGRVRVKKNIKVKIPVGVNNGSTLRVRGEGDAGPKGYLFHPCLCWPSVATKYVSDKALLLP